MEGAKKEGAGGFFTGVGKGLLGVVTKPIVGLIDGASQCIFSFQKKKKTKNLKNREKITFFFLNSGRRHWKSTSS